jgi:glycerol kinase
MTTAILAIDQGTTNSKAVLVSTTGEIFARGSSPVGIDHPQPGWVEQSPHRIWQSVQETIAACLQAAPAVDMPPPASRAARSSVGSAAEPAMPAPG